MVKGKSSNFIKKEQPTTYSQRIMDGRTKMSET